MRKVPWRYLLLSVVIGSALAAYFLRSRLVAPKPSTVVLVTLDTLRADHLGCYGYPRPTSPFIDELAAKSALFTRAFAPMSTTAPSHASLFTGLYPRQHGVKKNGQRLDPAIPTLAELMQSEGYLTAGFVSTNSHFYMGRMDRGFVVFREPRLKHRQYRTGTETVRQATTWLQTLPPNERLFLWVHLFDAHTPHDPAHTFPPESEAERDKLRQYLVDEQRIDFSFFNHDESRLFDFVDGYDGEVRAVDAAVRELFDTIRRTRSKGETVWIITGDHGEGLGNHRWLGHGKPIYNEQLRLPLLIHSSSGRFDAREIQQVVENIDLPATIADLIGTEFVQPDSLGRSLLPLLRNDWWTKPPKRYAFAERRDFDPRARPDPLLWELSGYEDGERQSLQDADYKYIRWTAGDDELYDLRNDPYETDNLVGTGLPEEERLRADLFSLMAALRSPDEPAAAVDQDTIERLRALGYDP